jgi:cytochrome b561
VAARAPPRQRHAAAARSRAAPRRARRQGRALGFYGLLLALPLSGLFAWFLPSEALGGLHDLGQTLLLWLIGLHVAAALVHQLWWRTNLIGRMT